MTGPPEPPTGEFPLAGHPGVPPGLRAWAQPSHPDGSFDLDRNGNPKVRRVHLRAETPVPARRPDGLVSDADWTWVTTTARKWSSVENRFGGRAAEVAWALARAGCGSTEHGYRRGEICQPPVWWIPDSGLASGHADGKQSRKAGLQALRSRAGELSGLLAGEWPGAAAALAGDLPEARLTWAVRAAEDLLAGRSYDGPRAFVQHHAGHTKAREDLPRLLADAGFEPDALAVLGVSRSPYIGVGGPLRARHDGRTLDWAGWPGPHDIRLPASETIALEAAPGTGVLLVIENRQAAEAICDNHPETAVIWCHGQPPEPVLSLIGQAAQGVSRVVICPDADLGGIRIAARVHAGLPAGTSCVIADAGSAEHDQGEQFSSATLGRIAEAARRPDAVGRFAAACLARGYAVEQEAPARAVLQSLL